MQSVVVPFLLAASLVSCGKPVNTPQQAFEALRQAVAEEDWQQVFHAITPSLQQKFRDVLERESLSIDEQMQQLSAEEQATAKLPYGCTVNEWREMTVEEKFAISHGGAHAPVALKLNPEEIRNSRIKDAIVFGDTAAILLDDGKGHRNRIHFALVDGRWYYDPEGGE